MKRTRKRIQSLVMAGAMLLCQMQLPASVIAAGPAAGQEYPLGELNPDNAKTKPTLSLTQEIIPLAEAKTNPNRKIELSVSGADLKYGPTGIHIQYDARLLLVTNGAGEGAAIGTAGTSLSHNQQVIDGHHIYLATSAAVDAGRDGVFWKLEFKLPSDVKAGDVFPIEIAYDASSPYKNMFTNANQDSDGQLMQAWAFTEGIEQGYIRIQAENERTVSFDANGGTGSMNTASVEKGSAYTLPQCAFTPPAGKVLSGWQVNETVMQPGDQIIINDNLTITALWGDPADNIMITFDAKGGTGTMQPVTINRNDIYILPPCTFTPPEGKHFAGWILGDTERVYPEGQAVQVTRDLELGALWESEICHLSFDANGGEGSLPSDNVEYGCEYVLPECPFTPPEGLEFVGWSANAAFYHPGETIRVLGDLTVLAVWESPYSGACGDNMAWEYDTETNTLTLQGEGMMYDFEAATDSDGNETFNVPWYSFSGNIEYVNLPEGLTTIGEYAFIDCDHLQSVEIPAGVSSIGNHAFDYCDSLREITLPESVAVIGKNAFANTAALERIIVLNPSANISDYNDATLGDPLNIEIASFTGSAAQEYAEKYGIKFTALDQGTCGANLTWRYDSKTKALTIEGKGDMTEYAASEDVPWSMISDRISSITLPDEMTSLSPNAFYRVSPVKSVQLPAALRRIGDRAFFGSSLEEISIPDGVTFIGKSAFFGTKLNQVTIPETVEQIGLDAFGSCDALTEILILNPKTVIGDSAQTISNGERPNGFDDSHGMILEYYFDGIIRGEADSTAYAYAQKYNYPFEALRHTIHFAANGGSGEMADVMPTYGKPYELPACTFTPPAKGMTCSRWLVCGELKAVGETIVVTDEIEAVPIWEYAVCKVTFAANGGKGKQGEMQAITGLEFSLPECRFTAPADKAFSGWQIGEKTYQPGETVIIEQDTEIKAVWGTAKQEYTVGDVDGSGTVDQADAILLSRYAAGWEDIVIDLKAADLNDDGIIDNGDVLILARYVADWDGYDQYIVSKTD